MPGSEQGSEQIQIAAHAAHRAPVALLELHSGAECPNKTLSVSSICRKPLLFSGRTVADSRLEPFWQYAGFSRSRVAAAVQMRPFESIIKLCAVACEIATGSLPQYGEGSSSSSGSAIGVPGLNGIAIWENEFLVGSSAVM